jgi:bacterioferritin
MYEKSIELLNKSIADEMTAVHQYMYFHFHCGDQGFAQLSSLFLRTAVEEMNHIERCADRILFLEGDVEMVASKNVQKVHDVKVMLEIARKMEQSSIHDYNLWANECTANADSGSRKVFEGLVDDEERHYSQFDLEKDKINKYGEQYLALQSNESGGGTTAGTAGA